MSAKQGVITIGAAVFVAFLLSLVLGGCRRFADTSGGERPKQEIDYSYKECSKVEDPMRCIRVTMMAEQMTEGRYIRAVGKNTITRARYFEGRLYGSIMMYIGARMEREALELGDATR